MPLEILDGEPPSPPPWGSLPLDRYLLSQWDSSQQPAEPPAARRTRLIRQFLQLGSQGRLPYNTPNPANPTPPTESQINNILRPARPESLRPYAEYTGSLEEGLYLRLCYDAEKDDAHEAVWSHNLDAAFVGPDGIVFDEEGVFGRARSLEDVLGVFPERVTNEGGVGHVERRERILRDILGGVGGEEDLLRYGLYHAACVVTHLFIEDDEALDGAGLLHVFLDDCGNVVRQWRTDDDGEDYDFDGTWKEGNWKEDFVAGRGELGGAYRVGGGRGPPYAAV